MLLKILILFGIPAFVIFFILCILVAIFGDKEGKEVANKELDGCGCSSIITIIAIAIVFY